RSIAPFSRSTCSARSRSFHRSGAALSASSSASLARSPATSKTPPELGQALPPLAQSLRELRREPLLLPPLPARRGRVRAHAAFLRRTRAAISRIADAAQHDHANQSPCRT